MEFHQPLRRSTSHGVAANGSRPGEGSGRIHDPLLYISARTHTNECTSTWRPPAAVIAEFEIPLARSYDFTIATRFECGAEARYVFFLDGDIQVFMRAGLRAEEGIYAPTSVNPYIYALALQLAIQVNYIRGGHMTYPGNPSHYAPSDIRP